MAENGVRFSILGICPETRFLVTNYVPLMFRVLPPASPPPFVVSRGGGKAHLLKPAPPRVAEGVELRRVQLGQFVDEAAGHTVSRTQSAHRLDACHLD